MEIIINHDLWDYPNFSQTHVIVTQRASPSSFRPFISINRSDSIGVSAFARFMT